MRLRSVRDNTPAARATRLPDSISDIGRAGAINFRHSPDPALVWSLFVIITVYPSATIAEVPEDSVPSFPFLVVYMLTGLSPGPLVS